MVQLLLTCLRLFLFLLIPTAVMMAEETAVVSEKFKRLKPGEYITATRGSTFVAKSRLQCATRCSNDCACAGYQYEDGTGNKCYTLKVTDHEDQTVPFHQSKPRYRRDNCKNNGTRELDGHGCLRCQCSFGFTGLHCQYLCSEYNNGWTARDGWNGSSPVLYRSFDNTDCLSRMEGDVRNGNAVITVGYNDGAIRTNRDDEVWYDLGSMSAACIAIPDTCGPEGAAVSFWVKLLDCPTYSGFLTSTSPDMIGLGGTSSGFRLECRYNIIKALLCLVLGCYNVEGAKPDDNVWTHVALIYSGPGVGVSLFISGELAQTDTGHDYQVRDPGDGRVAVGNLFTEHRTGSHGDLASVELDELVFFNHGLSEYQVKMILDKD